METNIIQLLEAFICAVVNVFGGINYDVTMAEELERQINVIHEIELGNYIFAHISSNLFK